MTAVCTKLHQIIQNLPRFSFPFDATAIPKNGIYFLFERDEFGHDGERIVRIGTHTGDNQLPSRLQQHFVTENKDRSIFRKNIGRAILAKNNDPYSVDWEFDRTSRVNREKYGLGDREKQSKIEQ